VEDIAITRVIPRMVVISPCDAIEAKKATIAAAKTSTPVYIRLGREKTPVITTLDTPFEIGKAQLVFEPKGGKADVGIIATGALLHKALLAAHKLEAEGTKVKVLNLATIKPLDEEAVWKLAKEAGAIVTVEEHQIAGGMGSAVAECLAKHYPAPIEFVGVRDEFGQSGKPSELIEHYGMGERHVYEAARKAMVRK
jgi:transketolase